MSHGCGWTALLTVAVSCGNPPRPQALVVIDTNLPVLGQLSTEPDLSPAAALDTLRIEVLDDGGSTLDQLEVIVLEPDDWPVSFGVASSAPTVTIRARLFQGALGGSQGTEAASSPPSGVTVDRTAVLALPTDGTTRVLIELDGDCLGAPARFGRSASTCVSAQAQAVPPSQAFRELGSDEVLVSKVGSWPRARSKPCVGPAPADAACIPGGFFVLGAPDAISHDPVFELDATILRAVVLNPYWMDTTEVTAGEYRDLGLPPPSGLSSGAPNAEHCSFAGAAADMAVNCLRDEEAREVCRLRGGSLPTEAQWEFAARGRGKSLRFPWGNEDVTCCIASVEHRVDEEDRIWSCAGLGPEPTRSHEITDACGGLGDVTAEGVYDLGGGVSEVTSDRFLSYEHECWGEGLLLDPSCESLDSSSWTCRGGNWSDGGALAQSALRHRSFNGDSKVGVRCVYPDPVE